MKNKVILFLLISLSFCNIAYGQQEKGGRRNDRNFNIEEYKQKKAAYLIKEVALTDAEAKAFIPLTEELMRKKFELNKSVRKEAKALKNKKVKTDDEYEFLLNQVLNNRIKEAELEKEYYDKFKKVLSSEKIYKYLIAEKKFTKNFVHSHENK